MQSQPLVSSIDLTKTAMCVFVDALNGFDGVSGLSVLIEDVHAGNTSHAAEV